MNTTEVVEALQDVKGAAEELAAAVSKAVLALQPAATPVPEPTPKPVPTPGSTAVIKKGVFLGPDDYDPYGVLPLLVVPFAKGREMLYHGCVKGPTDYVLSYGVLQEGADEWERSRVRFEGMPADGKFNFAFWMVGDEVFTLVLRGENGWRRADIWKASKLTKTMVFRFHHMLYDYSPYISDTHTALPRIDPFLGKIVLFMRAHRGKDKPVWPREVVRVLLDPLTLRPDVDFSKPVVGPKLSLPGTQENPADVYLAGAPFYIGNVMYVLPSVHVPGKHPEISYNSAASIPFEENKGTDNTIYVGLARSTDHGKTWTWPLGQKALIPNGTPGPNDPNPAYDAGVKFSTAAIVHEDGNVEIVGASRKYRHLTGTHDLKRFSATIEIIPAGMLS